ncbi:N-lysine methyltransferase KMT5A-A isoform X2 [Coregonus clupeaformis]|uniref:N-lysine methyltransferase KMT5A-A isoform X2 n=1 Tax=Coregonus clupeaformis TaxID=59861 RepID=UPI001BDF79F9|nr:N-lysine methyltransferase KMT5A-A isoform X2 [Coregonus clupeaformis]
MSSCGRVEMAKGKKNRPEETRQVKKKTKENKPEMNRDAGNCQPTIKSIWSPGKPRSPLCDYSSSVIQEENVPEKCTQTETSKKVKGRLNKVRTCLALVPRETTTLHVQEEDPESHPNPTAPDDNVTKPKTERGASQKVKVKKAESNAAQNRKVTDYYPIRRSSRKSKAELKNEEHGHLDYLIKNGVEEGLQVKHIEGKGRGVFAVRRFKKGQFVIEYHGDLLHLADAKEREALYAQDPGTGCYMYYFQYLSKTYCVDATKESTRLGRLLNHSKNGNCQTKLHDIDGIPHLILVASRDIEAKEELLYDYGDRSKESISAHPWLKY